MTEKQDQRIANIEHAIKILKRRNGDNFEKLIVWILGAEPDMEKLLKQIDTNAKVITKLEALKHAIENPKDVDSINYFLFED